MTGFLTLDDLVLTPPFPALVSLGLVLGLLGVAERGLRLVRVKTDAASRSAAFATAAGLAGAVVHGLAMAHLATLPVLRMLAFLCVLTAPLAWPVMQEMWSGWREDWVFATRLERAALAAVALTIGSLALASLGPVTDADSLDYHLGVPLDWLRHSGITAVPHWLHARITGLGEALNMLGLAAGTDGLGAVLQVSGLVMLAATVRSLGQGTWARVFGMMLVLPPVVIPLAASQKPQLLPAAALTVASVLGLRLRPKLHGWGTGLALIFGCVGFAMASKYSFLVSGGAVAVATLYWSARRGCAGLALRWFAISFGVFVLPVWMRNFLLYGDPLSPFFEGWRARPAIEILRFADYLRNAGAPHSPEGMGRFLVGLIVPDGFGSLQTVLGIGVVALLALSWRKSVGGIGFCVAAVALFTLWQGQQASRYALDPYLWLVVAVAIGGGLRNRWGDVLFAGLGVQTAGVAAMAMAGAAMLFPGALTPGLRERTMRRYTFGYEEARWVDAVVPADAVMMSESRAYALYPRPFEIAECAACGPAPLLELMSQPHDSLRSGHRTGVALVLHDPGAQQVLKGCVLQTIAGPESFHYAVRNPLARSGYEAAVVRLSCRQGPE